MGARTTLCGFTITAGALALLAASGAARAEQIVLFDTTYTHTNANDSHAPRPGLSARRVAGASEPAPVTPSGLIGRPGPSRGRART